MLMNPEIWVLVAFLIFFGLFGRQIWRSLAAILDGHADAIRAELAEAARLRAEAEQMLRDAETARAEALQEAQAVVARSRAEAAQIAQAAQVEAEAQAKRREHMALDRIAAAERAAVAEIRQAATDVAIEAARAVIAGSLSAADEAALVDHAISSLPRALKAA